MMLDLLLLACFAALAGFVDAVAGGGGLIQLPALLALCPRTDLPALFGTNKFAAIWGTAAAARQYVRRVRLPWSTLVPAIVAALACSWLGARTASHLPPEVLRPAVLVMLVLVALHTIARRDLGMVHAPRFARGHERLVGFGAGATLGFYDGLFGPGTGTFLIFVFVRVLGFDFLHASACAKLVNVATNLAALSYFAGHGHILWLTAAVMALANVAGALVGSRMAVARGSHFVRHLFLWVVAALIMKVALDTFRGTA
ncbi:MAG: sulfite exporter TauE/SafE family protein [Gammaproteobacteria bacterium]